MSQSAFREHASGLMVPAEISRERSVITYADWRTIDKATKILGQMGVSVYFGCVDTDCQQAPIERVRSADGGITLRCQKHDRVVVRYPK